MSTSSWWKRKKNHYDVLLLVYELHSHYVLHVVAMLQGLEKSGH